MTFKEKIIHYSCPTTAVVVIFACNFQALTTRVPVELHVTEITALGPTHLGLITKGTLPSLRTRWHQIPFFQ